MHVVVSFENGLAAVVEIPVTDQKTESAQPQVFLVVFLDRIGDKHRAKLVELAAPAVARKIAAQLNRLVDFCVGVRLMLAFVPSKAAEGACILRDLLFKVHAESVLDRGSERMRGDFGARSFSRK